MRETILKHENRTTSILYQAVEINQSSVKESTHFALCNNNSTRYLISLYGGKRRLSRNIATYSKKLCFLMRLLEYLPFSLLKVAKLGYFVQAKLHPVLKKEFDKLGFDEWNMIIGTYDEKQKLVLQCFEESNALATFIKIGNAATDTEMHAEINFLNERHSYKTFKLPIIIDYVFAKTSNDFNIQVTKEFVGDKIVPGLTKEIIQIYKEIASKTETIDGVQLEFSHGDFAPWNIKKNNSGYIVYDWEHCGMRIKGFDLMHYVVVPKVILEGKDLLNAYNESLMEIQRFIPDFSILQQQFEQEYQRLRLK